MDPISIAASCAGLVAALASTSVALARLVEATKQLRSEIEAAREEVDQLRGVAADLEKLLRRCESSAMSQTDCRRLKGVIDSCEAYAKVLVDTLCKYNSTSAPVRATTWVLSGQTKVRDVRDKLAARRDALSLRLITLSVQTGQRSYMLTQSIDRKVGVIYDRIQGMESSGVPAERIREWLSKQPDVEGSIDWEAVTARPGDFDDDLEPTHSALPNTGTSNSQSPVKRLELWTEDIAKAERRRSGRFFRQKKLNEDLQKLVGKMTPTQPSGDQLRALIVKGADPDYGIHSSNPLSLRSALHKAVSCGNTDCVRTLLCLGARPDGPAASRDHSPESPAMLALVKGDMKSLDLLLQAGADPNYSATEICREDPDVVLSSDEMQHPSHALFRHSRHWNPLSVAIAMGDLGAVRALLSAGADANGTISYDASSSPLQMTMLQWALEYNFEHSRQDARAIAKELLNSGADPDARRGSEALPPLVVAVMHSDAEVIQMLCGAGADVTRGHPLYALVWLASCSRFTAGDATWAEVRDGIEILLRHGADPRQRADGGRTSPLELARAHPNKAITPAGDLLDVLNGRLAGKKSFSRLSLVRVRAVSEEFKGPPGPEKLRKSSRFWGDRILSVFRLGH